MAQPGMAQQFSGSTAPVAQQAAGAQQSPSPQPGHAQPGNAQPPAAVVAWHGSPVPDGNGTWYYQPNIDPQTAGGTAQNGVSQNGVSQNGTPQNAAAQNGLTQNGLAPGGYAPFEPGTAGAAQSNGLNATPQFAQPTSTAGYQQTPALQQAPPLAQAQPLQAPPVQPTAQGLQQFTQPLAPSASSFQPTTAPTPLADAGTNGMTGTTGGAIGPANLGLPLSGQVPLGTSPGAKPAPPLATPSMASSLAAPPAATAAPAPPTVSPSETSSTGPLPATPMPAPAPSPTPTPASAQSPVDQSPRPAPAGPLSRLTGAASAVRGRRAARKPRLAMSAIFADLVDMADVPRSSYAVDEEVTGAMCLFKTDGGYEVFSCAEDARHEVRFFEDEEAAYFYLFGVLAAEALRNGRLTPRRG